MTTHSSFLAWEIPWTENPGGIQSTGSQRVRHDWSNLAHVAGSGIFLFFFFFSDAEVVVFYSYYLHLGCWKLFFFQSQFTTFIYFYFLAYCSSVFFSFFFFISTMFVSLFIFFVLYLSWHSAMGLFCVLFNFVLNWLISFWFSFAHWVTLLLFSMDSFGFVSVCMCMFLCFCFFVWFCLYHLSGVLLCFFLVCLSFFVFFFFNLIYCNNKQFVGSWFPD